VYILLIPDILIRFPKHCVRKVSKIGPVRMWVEVFAVVWLRIPSLWDMVLSQQMTGSQCFEATQFLIIQGSECWRSNDFGIWLSTDTVSYPRRIESSCMVVPISASFGVVSCVSVLTVHWPTVAIYLGFPILQTIEHLTCSCNLFQSCHSSDSWTLMIVLSLTWSCSLFRLCHSSDSWTPMIVLSVTWSCNLFRLCHSSDSWTLMIVLSLT
jgi:hypothetical protein